MIATRGRLLGHPMMGLVVVLLFCCICVSVNSNSITLRRQNHEFIQLQPSHPRYPVHRRMMEALVTRGRAINMNGGYLTLGAYCKFKSSSHFSAQLTFYTVTDILIGTPQQTLSVLVCIFCDAEKIPLKPCCLGRYRKLQHSGTRQTMCWLWCWWVFAFALPSHATTFRNTV